MHAIFPGTFDPPTLGHLNIMQRASKLFDPLIIGIGKNSGKTPVFTVHERMEMVQKITQNLPHVKIVSYDGLLVDFMHQEKIRIIVRAIRNMSDYDCEMVQAGMNRKLSGVETLFMTVDEQYSQVNSTLIKEVAQFGKRLDLFIPKEIEPFVFERLTLKPK